MNFNENFLVSLIVQYSIYQSGPIAQSGSVAQYGNILPIQAS